MVRRGPGTLPQGRTNVYSTRPERCLLSSAFLAQRAQFEGEVVAYLRAGQVQNHEAQVTGLEQAIAPFIGLFHRHNTGKMVKVAENGAAELITGIARKRRARLRTGERPMIGADESK